MIESISIRNCFNSSFKYLLKVYTKDAISDLFSKTFYLAWKRSIFLRKRRVEIVHKEIRIFLRKEDIIQKYIDHVSKVLSQTDCYIKHLQEKKSANRKQVLLRKMHPEKFYIMQRKASIS